MSYYDIKDHISNSMLGWFERSPSYYKYKITTASEEVETRSLENGKLLHKYIENPKEFIIADIVKPGPKTALFLEEYARNGKNGEEAKKFADLAANTKVSTILDKQENIDYLNFIELSSGKVCLNNEQSYKITNSIKALHKNIYSEELLFNNTGYDVFNELEIYFTTILDNDYEIKRKSKLDRVVVDHKNKLIKIIDLKTTSENPHGKLEFLDSTTGFISKDYYFTGFFKSFIGYKYYRQAAFYIDAVYDHFKDLIKDDYIVEFYFIVVELGNNFDVAIYKMSRPILQYGYNEIDNLLSEFGECLKQNNFTMNEQIYEI